MREQIKNYFKPFPRWALWMIGLGVLGLVYHSVSMLFIGMLLVGVGVRGFVGWSRQPTDAQMDLWLEDDLSKLVPRALAKTGTHPSELVAEYVMITGPDLQGVASAPLASKKGKDNVLRFTPVHATVINFTQNQLVVYSCTLDFTTGNPLNESTDEYFYNDVVSVATKTRSYNAPLSDGTTLQIAAAEMFQLTTSGGTSVEVLLRAPEIVKRLGGEGEIPTTRAEKAIHAVRKMLREKKQTDMGGRSAIA